MRRKFTDKFVRSLKAAPPGRRVEHWDLAVPCFGVRVTDKGHKTYVLYLRWPGSRTPARREVANADKLPLAMARTRAREWLALVELGVDPRQKQRQAELEARRLQAVTFALVAEAWFADREVRKQRKIAEVMSDVRREFLAPWGKRPITEITANEIATLIRAKAEDTPAQARNLLGYAKRLFGWAVDHQHEYHIQQNPAENLRAVKLVGKKVMRQRVLSDDELREVWTAAEETEYPYGPLFRMLILTGQRKSEVGDATWSEFDLDKRLWTIPPERMKMAAAHVVPLSDDAMALLASLPRFKQGSFLFSTTFGVRPANGFSKSKERLDELIGESVTAKWVIHDLRRTMRTNLSALPIPDMVRELMIAHAQPGLHQVYDQYSYLEEKRIGFQLWAAKLRSIVQPIPPTSNVIELRR
jgi:integrase